MIQGFLKPYCNNKKKGYGDTSMKRIGMLTSGGDCQSLNATMRGVVKGLQELVAGGV